MKTSVRTGLCFTPLLVLCSGLVTAAEAPIPPVPDKVAEPPFVPAPRSEPRLLVPGFTVRELPVKLTSLNNIEYAPDGRLFAGGYDGRFHLLRDENGDGLEETVTTFSPETSPNYPLGMVVKDGEPYAILADELIRFHDTDGDGVPDRRETVVKGFDDPELVSAPYLNHRRVDSSMALAWGPDGAWYFTMGNAGYNNPYWQENTAKGTPPSGQAHYETTRRRGCLLRLGPDGKIEQLNSGLRYIMSLQFNRNGDLFGTDQEGATWVPNGNPFDELLHLRPGRHYGFPPRHPDFLPGVVDEPAVWNYTPQHQSTCGFRFNTPGEGRGRFGPDFWEDDALVTGEARGKLWRTTLAKTAAGYVGSSRLFAQLGLLAVDCAISPKGDLLVCCHTGKPDWGNGPKGEGRILKFTLTNPQAPQPVLAWAADATETRIAFDRPLPEGFAVAKDTLILSGGRYLDADDAFESMRPGYQVVQMQQRQPRLNLAIAAATIAPDRRHLVITSAPRTKGLNYLVQASGDSAAVLPSGFLTDLHGLSAEWRGDGTEWNGWLPHPDLAAARQFTRSSPTHDSLWNHLATKGTLVLRGKLDLCHWLQPPTQPGAELGYEPAPERVTLVFRSDAALSLAAEGARVERISETESRLIVDEATADVWPGFTLTVATPLHRLDLAGLGDRDEHERAPGIRRFWMPFAEPADDEVFDRKIPELTGGDWKRGQELFRGKAACFTCHIMRGEGAAVGPDLNNLVHRDYASVLRDIVDPGAVINPDAIGYTVTLKSGGLVVGTNAGEDATELKIAQPGGQVAKIAKKEIAKIEALAVSLMPAGLDKALTAEELRDLLTYLLTEKAG